MVDCFDRIAVQMTEIVLEPIQQMVQRPSLTSVTILLPSRGRRVLLTVAKRFPTGSHSGSPTPNVGGENSPTYIWRIERGDESGAPVEVVATSPPAQRWSRPEDAFWAGIDALRTADRGHRDAG